MKIKELIEILSKHPNPEAEIIVTANCGNGDNEAWDLEGLNHIEIWGQDDFEFDHIDLFVCKGNGTDEDDK